MTKMDVATLCKRLVALLDNPHPGLLTWTVARNNAAADLHAELTRLRFGRDTPETPMDMVRAEWCRRFQDLLHRIEDGEEGVLHLTKFLLVDAFAIITAVDKSEGGDDEDTTVGHDSH